MTRYLLIALLTIQIAVKSQTVPQGINYQAVIRNSSGAVATNSIVSLKFSFYNSSALSPIIYTDTHVGLSTGPNGIVTCTIGMGIPSVGTFSNVAWENGDVWYSLKMDLGNTSIYTQVGVAQKFMTVPYSFYAGMAPTTLSVSPTTGGTNLYSVGGNSVFIAGGSSTTTPVLSYNSSTGILTSGPVSNSVNLGLSSSQWSITSNNLYPIGSPSVGIGTSTPNNIFQVKNYLKMENNGSNLEIGFGANSGTTSSSTGNYYNTSIGYNAGNATSNNANSNTFIGYGSGKLNTSGSGNTALGSSAGSTITVGNNNTFIGNNANAINNNLINATAIGNNAKVGNSNAMVLGDGNVNVGIGTSTPIYKLQVNENLSSNSSAAIFGGNLPSSPSSSNNSHGVYGTTNSTHTLAAGVYGLNTGAGSSIFGNKISGTGGNAGRFISTGSGINTDPAVYIENGNFGTAPALIVKSSNSGNTAAQFEGNVITNGDVTIPSTNNFKYSTPKTNYLSVSALAFNTEGTYVRAVNSGGVYIQNGIAGTQGNLYAPIQLPNTATITAIELYVDDDDPTLNVSYLQLWRQDAAIGSSFGNPVFGTTGASTGTGNIEKISTSISINNIVDNSQYCYFLRIGTYQSNSSLKIYKAVIVYQITKID